MKFCHALNGSLNIERDRVHFCVAVKQNLPTIPWNPDEDLPLNRIQTVRDAMIRDLNGDLDQPVDEYKAYGVSISHSGHPCKGCRHIVDVSPDMEIPSTNQLNCYLHLQAFTYCNAKCTYCNLRIDEGQTPLSRGRDLDRAVYRAVSQMLDSNLIAPTCRVIFSSGEPSLSKEGMEVLSNLTRKGFHTLINTNAIRFAPEIADALKSGKTHVQVSLESGDRDSYVVVKGVDKFDSVAKNVDRYLAAAQNGSVFWLKYIVYSQTNSRENIDKFVEFCREHQVRNVVVNANYNEGEEVSSNFLGQCPATQTENLEEVADLDSLKAFGYLSTKLEMLGINVHKEFAHLTQHEQDMVKNEYARAVIDALGHSPAAMDVDVANVIKGLEMASLPTESPVLRRHIADLLKETAAKSKGIALFSAGVHARWICSIMADLDIKPVVIFDNNAQTPSMLSYPVAKPTEVSNYDVDAVFIASNAYHLQIYSQLTQMQDFDGLGVVDPYLNLPLQ